MAIVTGLSSAHVAQAQWSITPLGLPTDIDHFAYAIDGDRVGGSRQASSAEGIRPGFWSGPGHSWVPLNDPSLMVGGQVNALWQGYQGGRYRGKPCVWQGTWQSRRDLPEPANVVQSEVTSGAGTQAVGIAFVNPGPRQRAMLWDLNGSGFTDLTPTGATSSGANFTDGTRQAGFASFPNAMAGFSVPRAIVWNGSANDYTDFSPGPTFGSAISAIDGDHYFGGFTEDFGTGTPHAAMWIDNPQGMIDMHPPGFNQSAIADGTRNIQIGTAVGPSGGFLRAAAWFGSASTYVDLSQFLPPNCYNSLATGVWESPEGIAYVSGYAICPSPLGGTTFQAFLWTHVPAPGPAITLALAGLWAARRRRASHPTLRITANP